jgi:hypothetical protein
MPPLCGVKLHSKAAGVARLIGKLAVKGNGREAQKGGLFLPERREKVGFLSKKVAY